MNNQILVARHLALIQVLIEDSVVDEGIPVISHATAKDVRGKHVFGVLPLVLAAEADRITEISLKLPAALRGQELSQSQVRQYMTGIGTYTVNRI